MSKQPYRLGDILTTSGTDPLRGEVVALQNIGPRRQVVTIRTDDGAVIPVTVDIEEAEIALPPASLDEAMGIARSITAGRAVHLPVSTQLSCLSAALISLGGAR